MNNYYPPQDFNPPYPYQELPTTEQLREALEIIDAYENADHNLQHLIASVIQERDKATFDLAKARQIIETYRELNESFQRQGEAWFKRMARLEAALTRIAQAIPHSEKCDAQGNDADCCCHCWIAAEALAPEPGDKGVE